MSAASSRRTSLASYRTDSPQWETVLDVDALAAAEGKSLGLSGDATACRPTSALPRHPVRRRPRRQCRARVRHVRAPLRRGRLQRCPTASSSSPGRMRTRSWSRRDWGPGTMTASGYPFVVKRLRRGQSARPGGGGVPRRAPSDVARRRRSVLRDSAGRVHGVGRLSRHRFLPDARFILLRPSGNVALDLPDAGQSAGGIVDGRLLVPLDEPWEAAPRPRFATDSLISYDLDEWKRDPLTAPARPGLGARAPRQTLSGVATTRGRLLVTMLDNVRGRAFAFDYAGGRWRSTRDRAAAQRHDRNRRRVRRERPGDVHASPTI